MPNGRERRVGMGRKPGKMLKRIVSLLLILAMALAPCLWGASGRSVHTADTPSAITPDEDDVFFCCISNGEIVLSAAAQRTDAASRDRVKEANRYTNSPLISYTQISPNRTSPRNHKIDTITIHSVQGNESTVERLGALFADPDRRASCNYAIGYDGRIALICPESDRSWCSSSRDNDNRAITVEVSTLAEAPDYLVYPAALEALIDLLTDVGRRNDIPALLFRNDKSLVGQTDVQNTTVHRWFAGTDCPGKDLLEKLPEICRRVNARLEQTGDLNGDGEIGIEDVTRILNMLTVNITSVDADVNSDSSVTVADVTELLDILEV